MLTDFGYGLVHAKLDFLRLTPWIEPQGVVLDRFGFGAETECLWRLKNRLEFPHSRVQFEHVA
jgi:hypothetical protein